MNRRRRCVGRRPYEEIECQGGGGGKRGLGVIGCEAEGERRMVQFLSGEGEFVDVGKGCVPLWDADGWWW